MLEKLSGGFVDAEKTVLARNESMLNSSERGGTSTLTPASKMLEAPLEFPTGFSQFLLFK